MSVRRLRRCLSALLLAAAGLARAAAPNGEPPCDLQWQFTPRLDAAPRRLELVMSFDGGPGGASELRLPGPWAGVGDYAAQVRNLRAEVPGQTVDEVPGQPLLRRIGHRPGERVVLRMDITSAQGDADAATPRGPRDGYRTLLGQRWFQAFGYALLPMVDRWSDDTRPQMCLDFDGLPADSRWASSFGTADGSGAYWRLQDSPARARHAVYLGGALALRERRIEGRPIVVATPPGPPPWRFDLDALADTAAGLIAEQRRFWNDVDFPFQLVVLQPNHHARGVYGGTAVHQALVMHAPDDLRLDSDGFLHLFVHEQLHAWLPDRFGPLQHAGRHDEALRYWFSEGFTDFYTHRLLLLSGRWSLDDYAAALNRKIDAWRRSPAQSQANAQVGEGFFSDPALGQLPYQRGEFLALRWHGALRAAGHPGLDGALRPLLLKREQAQRSGPLSSPLAPQRLLAALRATLGEQPLRDLNRLIERGEPFEFDARSLGPCFGFSRRQEPVWALGFDEASLKSRIVVGVAPDGPAHAAGLRDGMALRGYSIYRGQLDQDVLLQVVGDDGRLRELRYRPISGQTQEVLRYTPLPGALQQPACRGWMGLDGVAAASVPVPPARTYASQRAAKAKAAKSVKSGKPAGKPAAKPGAPAKPAKSTKSTKPTPSAKTAARRG